MEDSGTDNNRCECEETERYALPIPSITERWPQGQEWDECETEIP
jgi:hypothetical protein